jgi:Zn-dependent protease
MFVKHIIKILRVSVTIVWPSSGGPSFVLSAVTTFSACLRRQVVYLACGCMLSANIIFAIYNIIPNKQLDDANKQRR